MSVTLKVSATVLLMLGRHAIAFGLEFRQLIRECWGTPLSSTSIMMFDENTRHSTRYHGISGAELHRLQRSSSK